MLTYQTMLPKLSLPKTANNIPLKATLPMELAPTRSDSVSYRTARALARVLPGGMRGTLAQLHDGGYNLLYGDPYAPGAVADPNSPWQSAAASVTSAPELGRPTYPLAPRVPQ